MGIFFVSIMSDGSLARLVPMNQKNLLY